MTIEQRQLKTISQVTDRKLIDTILNGEDGFGWYDRAHSDLSHFASALGPYLSVGEVAAVTAILSPRCSVRRNCIMASQWFIESKRPDGVMTQRWNSVTEYYRTGEVGSPTAFKIKNFARALSGDFSACVNDVHVANLFGIDYGQEGLKPLAYHEITRRITKLARRFGLSVCDVQASLWVGHRRLADQSFDGDHVADLSLAEFLPVC